MSSVETCVRPCSSARALAPTIKNCTARGPAPQLNWSGTKSGVPDFADARLPHQRHRVADHVVGHRHFAHQPLQVENLVGRQDRRRCGRLSVLVVRRAISNSSSKFG